jgi:hypothetical protein
LSYEATEKMADATAQELWHMLFFTSIGSIKPWGNPGADPTIWAMVVC